MLMGSTNCRAEKDLLRLQRNVDLRVETLQKDLAERHAHFEVRLAGLFGRSAAAACKSCL